VRWKEGCKRKGREMKEKRWDGKGTGEEGVGMRIVAGTMREGVRREG
jgi:hypothetical protein